MKLTPRTSSRPTLPDAPEVTSTDPGRCPKCGMKLTRSPSMHRQLPAPRPARRRDAVASRTLRLPDASGGDRIGSDRMPQVRDVARADPRRRSERQPASRHGHGRLAGDGLEWEDLMPDINRQSDPSNMRWCLTDLETGAENGDIFWTFTVGDRVKIRLVNELGSDHPMHHPFHIHGAGRFLILSRDGAPDDEPGLEGHGPRARRPDGRHPARGHQPGPLDGALPHRRAHRERDDVQLRRPARSMNQGSWPGSPTRRGPTRWPGRPAKHPQRPSMACFKAPSGLPDPDLPRAGPWHALQVDLRAWQASSPRRTARTPRRLRV